MSIAIDPKAGTHFIGKIFVSPHACDRAVEYFGVDRSKAPMHVMDLLRKSSLISPLVCDEEGKPARMFAYRRTVFIVHPTEDTVYTLYPQHKANESVRSPIENLILRSIKTAERREKREQKRISIRKAELHIERGQAELRLAKSGSSRVIAEMDARITVIDEELRKLNRELIEAQREKTNIMKSAAAYT